MFEMRDFTPAYMAGWTYVRTDDLDRRRPRRSVSRGRVVAIRLKKSYRTKTSSNLRLGSVFELF